MRGWLEVPLGGLQLPRRLTAAPSRRWKRVAASACLVGIAMAGSSTTASATQYGSYLYPGTVLIGGDSLNTGSCSLQVQATDGNVVEYCGGVAIWNAATVPYSTYLNMQTDGNLVVYTSYGQALWQTDTGGYNPHYLVLQGDQNLVLYDTNNVARWASSWEHSASGAQTYAQYIFIHYSWSVSTQWGCLYDLWQQESNWTWNATNPSSGAYGIPQALPGSKMAAAGTDWHIGGLTQVHWGEDYISQTYGTPCAAWNHELNYGWY